MSEVEATVKTKELELAEKAHLEKKNWQDSILALLLMLPINGLCAYEVYLSKVIPDIVWYIWGSEGFIGLYLLLPSAVKELVSSLLQALPFTKK
jgi:mannosyltransferase OCH1-like enzyme